MITICGTSPSWPSPAEDTVNSANGKCHLKHIQTEIKALHPPLLYWTRRYPAAPLIRCSRLKRQDIHTARPALLQKAIFMNAIYFYDAADHPFSNGENFRSGSFFFLPGIFFSCRNRLESTFQKDFFSSVIHTHIHSRLMEVPNDDDDECPACPVRLVHFPGMDFSSL